MTLPMCCSQESDPEAAEGGRLAAESDSEKVIARYFNFDGDRFIS